MPCLTLSKQLIKNHPPNDAFASLLCIMDRDTSFLIGDDKLFVVLVHGAQSFLAETIKETTQWEFLFLLKIVIDGRLIVVQEDFFVD